MGDTNDGSSIAAPGALPVDGDEAASNSGFLRKFFSIIGPSGEGAEDGEDTPDGGAPTVGLANLRRMRVEDVAIPKVEIEAVPNDISLEGLVDVFRESGMSRLPVYEGTLDTPVGMIHLKDFALKHGFGETETFDINGLIRPLLFVPPSMTIGVLLQKMQTERRHMALVIDEYGGVDGLLTIEDLIEQVVGEIEDEHDTDDDQFWTKEPNGRYIVLAKTPLDDFEEELGHSLTDNEDVDEEEIDTLGGLIFMLAGRVPARGEVIQHPAGFEFEVIDADPRRIKRMRVRPTPEGGVAAE
ncbi:MULTISPECIES: hemolysin family protein [Donghicola]|jgi:magnesium and cobalt transporter|uniref:Putative conjugation transfer protein n=1 Tax=Donghicola eburneus TaxID=393278 RepID=A0A1M4MWT6_9RHOB|nr:MULTISPECIES: hemolysin family protein [Donghicola]MCT4575860.1 hemolysin family protein [Donghicola sp.]SCM67009.1 putative conjugation transfer protein [Donghicola eburneus]SFQ73196.1 magnesium and cobalt transporter [Donghicola eburneus]